MRYKYSIQKEIDKTKTAQAVGISLGISAKHAKEVCDFIRGKKAEEAITLLRKVISKKTAVPYRTYHHDLSHKSKIGPGRYPVKTCEAIITIIESAIANAQHKNLAVTDLYITHICSHIAARAWHPGRHTRRRMKRAHVEVLLEGMSKEIEKGKKENKTQQKEDAARETGTKPKPAKKTRSKSNKQEGGN